MYIEDCCEILDSMRVPITASDREEGDYPYYGAMVFKTMSLIIFLMMNLYYLQKMVVTLAQKKNLLHIEFQENAGSITMLMF